jgi:hypothetical protein
MKYFILSLFFILNLNNLSAAELEMSSKVESVVLYHSGALIKRQSAASLPNGVSELLFKNVSNKMLLNSLKMKNSNVTILNKQLITKITNEQFEQLLDRKSTIQKQISLIEEKYIEVGFVKNVEDLEKLTLFYSSRILKLKKDLRLVDSGISEAKKIENIKLDNKDAAILKLIVSVQGKLVNALEFEYICGGIGWSPYYEIDVKSSSNKSIEIKYFARIMNQTGEDWDNVSIYLSSSFPLSSPTSLPKMDKPWVLNGSGSVLNLIPQVQLNNNELKKLEGVKYQEINVPSNLKIVKLKGKSDIKSNSTVFTFPIKRVNLPAKYNYYGFPNLDPEVYLVAEFTDWDTLGFVDGVADMSFAGNNVGKSIISFSDFKSVLTLPIVKDNSVFMKRTEIADQKYFKISKTSKKKTTTIAYRYELKNNNSFPIQFKLLDQVPISQTKRASVELIDISNAVVSSETGEVDWNIEIESGEEALRKLIFTIEMDAKYRYKNSNYRRKKFTPVSSPSF